MCRSRTADRPLQEREGRHRRYRFRCRPLTEPASETIEAAEVAWIDPGEISQLMTPTFTVRVLDAFQEDPQVRAHDGTHLLD